MNYKEEKRGPTMILVQSPWGKTHNFVIAFYVPIASTILDFSFKDLSVFFNIFPGD